MNKDEVLRMAKECGVFGGPFSTQEYLESRIERFAAAMYAKGEEDMRERAVDKAYDDGARNPIERIRERIRALPITPTNTEGEQG